MGTKGRYSSISRARQYRGNCGVGGDSIDRTMRKPVESADNHPAHGTHDHRRGEVADSGDRLPRFGHVGRLQFGHLFVDCLESLDRVSDLNRQVVEKDRDPIVGHALDVVMPRRHRHHRADEGSVGVLAPREEQIPVAATDDGEHDVVDRAAEHRADRSDVAEARGRVSPGTVGTDAALDRQWWRSAEVASEACEPPGGPDGRAVGLRRSSG